MKSIKCRNYTLMLDHPIIMGILNVTPDSFSDGGRFLSPEAAISHAKQMVADGAEIIDIGGESTRPGSDPVPAEEELHRVIPVVDALLREVDVPISIDTMKPEVADACLKLGVHILNDVTGLRNPDMIKIAAKYNIPTIIMHMKGMPKTMQLESSYDNVIEDIKSYLQQQAIKAKATGISQIILDPGIGFGKTVEHNLTIIKNLLQFKKLGYPLLIGPSRKSFIGKILDLDVDNRLEGTIAAVTAAVFYGADIIRVHDVKECKRAAMLASAIAKN